MSIRHNDHRHDTVAQVRACHFGEQGTAEDAKWDAEMQRRERAEDEAVAEYKAARDSGALNNVAQYNRQADSMSQHLRGANGWATDKQLAYIKGLLAERDTKNLGSDIRTLISHLHQGERITKHEASRLIEELRTEPKLAKASGGLRDLYDQVGDGRYAVEDEGTLKFYRVGTSENGERHRWMMVQASDELHRIGYEQKVRVLTEIAKDPQEAMLRYGRELNHCGHCGRTLTNEESRERGIGPICAGKMGWAA